MSALNALSRAASAIDGQDLHSVTSLSENANADQEELVQAVVEEHKRRHKAGKTQRDKHKKPPKLHTKDLPNLANEMLAEGLEVFLGRVNKTLAEHGIQRPTVTVTYKDLNVLTTAVVGRAGIATVGGLFLKPFKLLMGRKPETTELKVLNNLQGILRPARFTLLLGPPGAGKSTFLKVISGRHKKLKNLKVSGELLYNGVPPSNFQIERTVAYVDQHDKHIPVLTVGETLNFAYLCTTKQSVVETAPFFPHKKRAKPSKTDAATNNTGAMNGENGSRTEDSATLPQNSAKAAAATSSIGATDDERRNASGTEKNVLHSHPIDDEETATMYSTDAENDGVQRRTDDPAPLSYKDTEDVEAQKSFEDLLRRVFSTKVRTEVVMRLLGITHIRNSIVGDAMVRGISGGERKRVTTAEMLVGRACVLVMDEISTGLDSGTLYSIITWLGQVTHGASVATCISLLQPPPEVFFLFDDVILMTDGMVVYHGPVHEILHFTDSLGFELPKRMDLPSFLLEVTTPKGQWKYASSKMKQNKLQDGVREETSYLVPVEDMSEKFWMHNKHGIALREQLETPFDSKTGHPDALCKDPYALGKVGSFKLDLWRQWKLFIRNQILIKFRLVQLVIVSVIIGTIFLDLQPNLQDFRSFYGAGFVSILFIAFGSAPELGLTMQYRTVWYKYRDNKFLPATAEAASQACIRALNSIYEAILLSCIVYFLVGFTASPRHFFSFVFSIICIALDMSAVFRFIGCISATQAHAQAFGALGILLLVLTSGFAIVSTSIPPWFIWVYYLSPFAYCLRSIAINEMSAARWDKPAPDGRSVGTVALKAFGFQTSRPWIWAGWGYMILFYLILNWMVLVALRFYSGPQHRASVPDRKQILEDKAQENSVTNGEVSTVEEEAVKSLPETQEGNSGKQQGSNKSRSMELQEAAATQVNLPSDMTFTQVTLVIEDLRYFVPNPSASKGSQKKKKTRKAQAEGTGAAVTQEDSKPAKLELLKGITAFVEPGILTALMGGSGAGKTTLMDVIAGRKTVGEITGNIYVNGKPKQQESWSRMIGYVEQMDIHTPNATVIEALWFSARSRLPSAITNSAVRAYVSEVVQMVDMENLTRALVGTPGESGLSTEQRKRLTIAVELVANPSVLFMDEPTSGLDARAAAIVMHAVKNIALNGRTIVVTIHQPSINIFEAFDYLLLLQRGGRLTYFGRLGEHSALLISYLEGVPGTHPITPGYNPATWMLEVTGGSMATVAKPNDVDWPQLYKDSDLGRANVAHAQALVRDAPEAASQSLVGGKYAQPFRVQLRECARKLRGAYWRMPNYNFVRLAMTAVIGVIYGAMYYNTGRLSAPAQVADVQNIIGVLFSSSNFLGNVNLMTVMPVVSQERVVFYRERAASMYSPFAMGLAMILVELPYIVMEAIIFTPIVYFMVGFENTAEKFFFYFLLLLACIAFFTSFGMLLVHGTPIMALGQILSSALNFLFNLLNGFVVPYGQMPVYWQWANRITPSTWVIYGLAASQLGDKSTPLIDPSGQKTTVKAFLESVFGYKYEFRWFALIIVFAYVIFCQVGVLLLMRYVNFLKR